MFNGPIPGESLTRAPKSFPWERPPEYTDPEDVLMHYLDKMMKPDVMESMMDALEIGMTVKDLTEGVLRTGVSEGLHTIDVSMLVAPAVHEAIKRTAEDLGVEFEEGLEDKEAKRKSKEKAEYLKSKVRLRKFKGAPAQPEEMLEEMPEEIQEELPMDMPKRGLMARGT